MQVARAADRAARQPSLRPAPGGATPPHAAATTTRAWLSVYAGKPGRRAAQPRPEPLAALCPPALVPQLLQGPYKLIEEPESRAGGKAGRLVAVDHCEAPAQALGALDGEITTVVLHRLRLPNICSAWQGGRSEQPRREHPIDRQRAGRPSVAATTAVAAGCGSINSPQAECIVMPVVRRRFCEAVGPKHPLERP